MGIDRRRDTLIETLCTVKSELPPSADVRCEHADVARRAYELYELRGRIDGFDADDWRQAERELRDDDAIGVRASTERPIVPDAPPNENPPNIPPPGVPQTPPAPPTPTDEPPPEPIDDPPPEDELRVRSANVGPVMLGRGR